MSGAVEEGLRRMDEIGASGALESYYLLHSARADLLQRLGRTEEAGAEYRKAAELTRNEVERRFLAKRMLRIAEKKE
jgi:RNA polymerase sigma-70 factor (ECF subfamily)